MNLVLQIKFSYESKITFVERCEQFFKRVEDEYETMQKEIKLSYRFEENQTFEFDLNVTSIELHNYGFDPNRQTKLIIHPYNTHPVRYCRKLISAYKPYEPNEFNFICVDWSAFSNDTFFFDIPRKSMLIGEIVGKMFVVKILVNELLQNPEMIHIIGYSAAAHLAGQVGKTVKQNGTEIGRITALDPPKPCYKRDQWLTRNDAKFVDIIHTNGGPSWPHRGIFEPIGHIDFYPNGGQFMPGCSRELLKDPLGLLKDPLGNQCSHNRALLYFIESVNHRRNLNYFKSIKCESYEKFKKGECDGNMQVSMGEGLNWKK